MSLLGNEVEHHGKVEALAHQVPHKRHGVQPHQHVQREPLVFCVLLGHGYMPQSYGTFTYTLPLIWP